MRPRYSRPRRPIRSPWRDAPQVDQARALEVLEALRTALRRVPEALIAGPHQKGVLLGPRVQAEQKREDYLQEAARTCNDLMYFLRGSWSLRELLPILPGLGILLGDLVACPRPWRWCRDVARGRRFSLVHVDEGGQGGTLGLVFDVLAPDIPDELLDDLLEPVRVAFFDLVALVLSAERMVEDLAIEIPDIWE